MSIELTRHDGARPAQAEPRRARRITERDGVEGVDRIRRLDAADKWTADMFAVAVSAGAVLSVDVDMSRPVAMLRRLSDSGVPVTYAAVFVRACALALARHPDLHLVFGGGKRMHPGRVDIGLSVAGESPCAPVMVLDHADRKSLSELSEEIRARTPVVREKERRDLARLRRWGRLVPWSGLRRRLLGTGLRRPTFRRSIAGTFQVTTLRTVDVIAPLSFLATGAVGAGAVRERVVAVDGRAVVRPVATLTCPFDHKVWDGTRAATFLGEVRRILEEEDLATSG